MKKISRKTFLKLVGTTAAATAVAACSSDSTSSSTSSSASSSSTSTDALAVNPAGVFPITPEKTSLSVMIRQRAAIADLNNHEVVKYISEKLNIELNMTIVSDSAWTEKVNLALSTGTYPDIIMSGHFSNAEVLQYGVDAGIFIPINDEIETYCVAIKDLWAEQDYLEQDMTAPDGNIYGFCTPQGAYEFSDVSRKLWVNEEWMNNLGISEPTTTEEFKDMLMAFKYDDPNGNGTTDEVPISGAISTWAGEAHWWLMNSFLPVEPYNKYSYFTETGELKFAPIQDEWKEGLMYVADLYNEGLLDPASFTNTQAQMLSLGMTAGDEILGCFAGGHVQMGIELYSTEDDRGTHWGGISIPKGPNGFQEAPLYATYRKQDTEYVVTDKCENVAAAVRFGDWLLSPEGCMMCSEGMLQEGAIVPAEDGELNEYGTAATYKKLTTAELEAAGITPDTAYQYSWNDTTVMNKSASYKALFVGSQDPTLSTGYTRWQIIEHEDHTAPYVNENRAIIPPVWIPADKVEELSAIETPLFDFIQVAAVEFITGARNFDDWDSYLKDLENMKYPEWFETYETAVMDVMDR